MKDADLEIAIHRRGNVNEYNYSVELSLYLPDSDESKEVYGNMSLPIQDRRKMLKLIDPKEYGEFLWRHLFSDVKVKILFEVTRTKIKNNPLRIRLFIGPSAPELQSLRWETLYDPEKQVSLFKSESFLFSRYLTSSDWRRVCLRLASELRSLVVVANPNDLNEYAERNPSLVPLDVPAELARASKGLGENFQQLASGEKATLKNILNSLRNVYDIVYIVCHGTITNREPILWLEKDDGKANHISANQFIEGLNELAELPRLIILASCQGAGTGEINFNRNDKLITAFGARLIESGVPAVLAMNGNIPVETMGIFMTEFLADLKKDGQIDKAVAVARKKCTDDDYWMPVLFMRLRSGRICRAPGFASSGFKGWPAFLNHVKPAEKPQCTPILGPGLTEPLFGSANEIAQKLAENHKFPLQSHYRKELHHVAQFLAITHEEDFPHAELRKLLREQLIKRWSVAISSEMKNASLEDLLKVVGKWRYENVSCEPHKELARLKLPLYITTNPDDLLEDALRMQGENPQMFICPWNVENYQDPFSPYIHDENRPLVYHLFGHFSCPESLVLTEDDYFNYLLGVTRNKDLIPDVVQRALVRTPLLLLGFQLDDWNFRVVFRSIIRKNTGKSRYAHIAAQIDPDAGYLSEPEKARQYIERYFDKNANINIYWGHVEDFLGDLRTQLDTPSLAE